MTHNVNVYISNKIKNYNKLGYIFETLILYNHTYGNLVFFFLLIFYAMFLYRQKFICSSTMLAISFKEYIITYFT